MTKVFEALKRIERSGGNGKVKNPPLQQQDQLVEGGVPEPMEEAMVCLYLAIAAAFVDGSQKIIQFVSSRQGEGTSTIVKELARISAVRMGKSVLIIDADRRRPIQHRFFGVSPDYYLEDAIRTGEATENLSCPSGHESLSVGFLSREGTSVCELLASRHVSTLFEALRNQFDLILIDSPSVTASPDCLSICARVDGVVLVVEAENTRWPVAEATKEKIIKSGGNILGVVLNKRQYHIPEFVYRRL
jgi:capsular exopolysaccharide synthesis family protein